MLEKTVSLWSYMNDPKYINRYRNPFYEKNNSCLYPEAAMENLQLWKGYFHRYTRKSKKSISPEWKMAQLLKQKERLHQTVLDLEAKLRDAENGTGK